MIRDFQTTSHRKPQSDYWTKTRDTVKFFYIVVEGLLFERVAVPMVRDNVRL